MSAEPFVFEFAGCTCISGYVVPPSIAVEGLAMFSTVMRDFSEFCNPKSFAFENAPVYKAFISDYFKRDRWYDKICRVGCKIGEINENGVKYLFEKFEEFCEVSDCTLVIAPEDDMLLYNLSKIADKYNNLGSPSEAVRIASDKWKVYRKLRRKVTFPETSLHPLDCKCVVKPRISCGGAGIRMAMHTDSQSSEQFKRQFKSSSMEIYQEYVEGIPLSVSLVVGEDANVISLNEQILDGFEFAGVTVPAPVFRQKNEKIVKEVVLEAMEAVTSLKLFGYCGVDVIYADRAYVVDVNARLTTPAVAFKAVYDINIGEIIFKNFEGLDCSSELREKRVNPAKLVKQTLKRKEGGEVITCYGNSTLILGRN